MDFNTLLNNFKTLPNENKSVPFWSWNNTLKKEELIKQIDEMKEKSMGGFIIHARIGLKEEYLGEKWFDLVDACIKRAKELDMEAWIYDENGWPSGFVGGKLLENESFRAPYFELKINEVIDINAYANYIKKDDHFELIDGSTSEKEIYSIYLLRSPSNTDILNPNVVDEFLKLTHEEYYKRFKDSFGKELKGFFTDEPQYYRWGTAYSEYIEPLLNEKGLYTKENAIYLFFDLEAGKKYKFEYYKALNELYLKNYYKRLYDWCDEHNCMLTGHSLEEGLGLEMWCDGGVMKTYMYEHVPGVDFLCKNIPNEYAMRQIGSSCNQLNKHEVLSETFACGGHDMSPTELKSLADFQYFNGITKTCQHLFPYSIANQGRTDHPPVFSHHSNWFDEFKMFNEYFNRLSYIISHTNDRFDIGVIHPIRDAYLRFIRKDEESLNEKQAKIDQLLDKLRISGITYEFIDESMIEDIGSLSNDELIMGESHFNTIIIPDIEGLSKETYNILKNYKGKLLILGDLKYLDGEPFKFDLKSNTTYEEIENNRLFKFSVLSGRPIIVSRAGDAEDYLFVKNYSNKEEAKCKIDGISKEYKSFDLIKEELNDITDELTLPPSGSLILYKTDLKSNPIIEYNESDITKDFFTQDITENYLILDKVSLSKDGVKFTDYKDLQMMFNKVLKEDYKGDLYVRYHFNLLDIMPIKLILEYAEYDYVKINNNIIELNQSEYDILYREQNIGKYLKLGENVIEYKIYFYEHDGVHFALFDPLATESVINCLYYDSSLETAYLKGNFIVNDDHSLSNPLSLPKITKKLEENGYPFFRGIVTISGSYFYDGIGNRVLKLDGRYLVANVLINDKKIDYLFGNEQDISKYLVRGKNDIKLFVKSSNRNLYGSHHYIYKEPDGIAPINFTFRALWDDEKAPSIYTPIYQVVDFGIEKIIIKEEVK